MNGARIDRPAAREPRPVPRAAALRRPIAWWLFACALLVCAVLSIGGVTRLTHSGLSIVQWQPLVGAVPPLSEHDWQVLFDRYREFPEFIRTNPHMTLQDFKPIFWWEYAHRLAGRLAGLALLLPWIWFALSGRIERTLGWRLAGILALGALQGGLGWSMVASGLIDDPHVSPVLLCAHLGLALLIIGSLLWTAWDVRCVNLRRRALPAPAAAVLAAVFIMALSGAVVAGTGAGHVYNTFPLMAGHLIPAELTPEQRWPPDVLLEPAVIQFVHRMLAFGLLALVPWLFRWIRRNRSAPPVRRRAAWMLAAFAAQFTLGVVTLLSAAAMPLAVAHQAGAVVLFAAVLWNAHGLTTGQPSAAPGSIGSARRTAIARSTGRSPRIRPLRQP